MGKVTAAGDKIKGEYHEQMAKHGPESTQGEHAADAAKFKTKEKAEKHL